MFKLSRASPLYKRTVFITSRNFVKVGDKVPVNYLKDEKPPQILADKEYPEWLFEVGKKGLSKQELIDKYNSVGVEKMTRIELRRMNRLMNLEVIKESNAAKVVDTE